MQVVINSQFSVQFLMVVHALTCVSVHILGVSFYYDEATLINSHILIDDDDDGCSNLPGVIECVPFSRVGIATVGCVVAAHSGA